MKNFIKSEIDESIRVKLTYLFLLCMSEDGEMGGSGGVTELSELPDESSRMPASFGSRICRSSHSTKSAHSFSPPGTYFLHFQLRIEIMVKLLSGNPKKRQ